MKSLNNFCSDELTLAKEQNLFRELHNIERIEECHIQINSKNYLNFSSNDYLGLNRHPALKEAAIEAIKKYGAGTSASRLVCGHLQIHHQLEEQLSIFKTTEAALTFSSGYATAFGVIPSLMGKEDVIILDKLCHACLIDGARQSQATLRIFKHNDLNQLESHLQWAKNKKGKILIITESIFSMDGDAAPLKEIVDLKEKYGAWLFVDEAHSTGIFGQQRAGLCQALDINHRIEIQMGTLSKAIGVSGGYIAGSQILINFLINRARSFIFSTAVPPANAAAALASLQLIRSDEGKKRCETLWQRIEQFQKALMKSLLKWQGNQSPIFPVLLKNSEDALQKAQILRENGFWIPAIRHPTVPKNQPRLRITLSASHSSKNITQLIDALNIIV